MRREKFMMYCNCHLNSEIKMHIYLYMVEVRGSNPLSPTLLRACK